MRPSARLGTTQRRPGGQAAAAVAPAACTCSTSRQHSHSTAGPSSRQHHHHAASSSRQQQQHPAASQPMWRMAAMSAMLCSALALLQPAPDALAQMQLLRQPAPPSRPQASTAVQAADAIRRLDAAAAAVEAGAFEEALAEYSFIVKSYPELALAEYARIGQALLFYQVGRTSDSILLLEDESVALRGSAEVNAALAAILFAERPALRLRAEALWEVATEFDTRYNDVQWVRARRPVVWPPRALDALERFLRMA